jgi:flagellar biosynthesis/type III secretory pathway chaperone
MIDDVWLSPEQLLAEAINKADRNGIKRPMSYVAGYIESRYPELSELIMKLQDVNDRNGF